MQAMCVGVPGTGKTYFMVHYLKKYFTYDDFFREYHIKENVLILSNIAGLQFFGASCWNIESPEILGNAKEGIAGKYTREQFFTVANMEKIMEKTGKKNIILVVDEIQNEQYFPSGYKDAGVLYLFAYHRHIGMDIILGTQDVSLVSRGVLAQCEYLAHGKLRSKKIFGAMSYRFTDNRGGYMYDKTLKTDKSVFAAYQSQTVEEKNKPKSALLHWVIITAVFLVIAGGLFKGALATIANKAKPENTKKMISPSAAALAAKVPVPVPGPVAPPYTQAQLSSIRAQNPVVVPPPSPPLYQPPVVADLPRVIGLVGDTDGKGRKYLLSTGQIITCKKQLNIGDVYIR